MKKLYIFFCLCCLSPVAFAQTDSLLNFLEKDQDTTTSLLPTRMMPTQRLLWGNKGLLRTTNIYPLNIKGRERELRIRRRMLRVHQILGFATLGSMVAQGIVGQRLYNGEFKLAQAHKNIAAGMAIGYFTTASLSLFSPPPAIRREKEGNSTIRWHKRLAFIHFTGMVATLVLGELTQTNSDYRPAHRIAAFTTFGAFTASMVVMTF